jgi:hypothetical protein
MDGKVSDASDRESPGRCVRVLVYRCRETPEVLREKRMFVVRICPLKLGTCRSEI